MTRTRQRPRKNRRFIAVFATLAVFAGLVAVTQVSLAGSWRRNNNSLPVCPPSAAAPATSHDHSNEQDPDATPPADAPPGEVAGAAGDGTTGDAPPADAESPAADAPAEDAEAAATTPAAQQQQQQRRRDGDRQRCRPASTPTSTTGGGSNGGGSNGGGSNGGGSNPGSTSGPTTNPTSTTSPTSAPPPPTLPETLGNTCEGTQLQEHDGFQNGPRCVGTQFGEVGAVEDNPTLLISRAPGLVRVNQQFDIQVSTRNLVRDRFLPAAAGGYYKESSRLTEEGLQRGHFHVACRLLSGRQAQDPAPVPAFFKAVEDGGGGANPDTVTVTVPGLAAAGVAQCAAWAGDGSHRIPMMVRANQIPAFDSVRVVVR
ncbi:Pecanex-like protein 1 [Asanoa sp. WMMD1127]|uniref:Pecanex-like protein 1 n=1 Tax=Asanoa sp. WMMD1127 TaxID=3016107 RepID=UPI002416EE46|nr:Pecanex-like protein 1 [Asanoa sp. WMMD1127]MDG4823943.1 Pecanex-like protein 1 [Asanoa sp. WMMD1127]